MKKRKTVITLISPVCFTLSFLLLINEPLILMTIVFIFGAISVLNKAWKINFNEFDHIERKLNEICYLSFNNKFVFVGKFKSYQTSIDAEQIIIDLQEKVYDEYGECSNNWLEDVTTEEQDQLNHSINKTLQLWLNNNNYKPTFGELKILKFNRESEGK